MEIVSVAGPLPDVGDTTSHGTFDVAVQVTVSGAGLRQADGLRRRLRRERRAGRDRAED